MDYFTIHAGLLLAYVPMTAKRVTARGGRHHKAKWCLLIIRKTSSISISARSARSVPSMTWPLSGDGLRPGSIADANDEAILRAANLG